MATLDQTIHATIARLTGGVSPAGIMVAWTDWATHVAASPERQKDMALAAIAPSGVSADDPRFKDPVWNLPPFVAYKTAFLAAQNWWDTALAPLSGVDPKHQRALQFYARQALDMFCPANFALTNPMVAKRAWDTRGESVRKGWENWITDLKTTTNRKPRQIDNFVVGQDVATSPGDVVFRNQLVELLHYKSRSSRRKGPPVFIVPAWIMKFYILDLSPENSLIGYLTRNGFDVFTLSWKNPGREDADLDLNDYLELGIREPLQFLKSQGLEHMHAAGYCLGGTLLAIAAASHNHDAEPELLSLTLLASQTDFTEPGELGTFMTEAQVAFLEDLMADQGYLEAHQMAAAFQMLRSADLIWSRVIRHYLMGERTQINDLMAWNADSTRMPARMHTTYLRRLFLENGLANRTYRVDGHRVSLTDIRAPMYCLATEADHVSPWRSVFKLLALTDTDVRFVLTNGGHNGGVLSEPGHSGRHFRILDKQEGTRFVGPDAWYESAVAKDGSWWGDWTHWLTRKSRKVSPMRELASLAKAPGSYVFD